LVWTGILVIALAALVAMLFAALTTPGEAERCSWINAEKVSVETVERLRDGDWFPVSGDDKEALYSKGCLTPGSGA
jgi:hypothetical protein